MKSRSVMGKDQFLCSLPKWAGLVLGPCGDYGDKGPAYVWCRVDANNTFFFFVMSALSVVHFQQFHSVLAYLLAP